MNYWQKRVQELEESFNSFKKSTAEKFVNNDERLEAFANRIEGLETRTVELESKKTPRKSQDPLVSYRTIEIFEFFPEFFKELFNLKGC